jgi:hypothetical protein
MTNLLANPSFELGWRQVGDCQLPHEWDFWFADADTLNPYDPAPWSQFVQPEARTLNRIYLPPEEQDVFILDGDYTFKVFKGSGAWYMRMEQVLFLEPALYEFKPRVFGDLVKAYNGKDKVWADDADGRDGLLRFTLNDHAYDWNPIVPGEWTQSTLEFAAEGDTTLGVEIMCPFALKNSGIFADDWSLTKVSVGGVYYKDSHTIILPKSAGRSHAHQLVDMLYDELDSD